MKKFHLLLAIFLLLFLCFCMNIEPFGNPFDKPFSFGSNNVESTNMNQTICKDDKTWTNQNKSCKDYSIAGSNCSDIGDNNVSAFDACLVACDNCPKSVEIKLREPSPIADYIEPSYSTFEGSSGEFINEGDIGVNYREIFMKLSELEEKINISVNDNTDNDNTDNDNTDNDAIIDQYIAQGIVSQDNIDAMDVDQLRQLCTHIGVQMTGNEDQPQLQQMVSDNLCTQPTGDPAVGYDFPTGQNNFIIPNANDKDINGSTVGITCGGGYTDGNGNIVITPCRNEGEAYTPTGCSPEVYVCALPDDISGYNISTIDSIQSSDTLTRDGLGTITCEDGYNGTGNATCRNNGGYFELSGCNPDPEPCAQPTGDQAEGYDFSRIDPVNLNLQQGNSFSVSGIQCAPNYYPTGDAEDVGATTCASPGGFYSLTGCDACPVGEREPATQDGAGLGTIDERCGTISNTPVTPATPDTSGTPVETVRGCTDSNANNYDPEANEDDGNCRYDCTIPIADEAAIVENMICGDITNISAGEVQCSVEPICNNGRTPIVSCNTSGPLTILCTGGTEGSGSTLLPCQRPEDEEEIEPYDFSRIDPENLNLQQGNSFSVSGIQCAPNYYPTGNAEDVGATTCAEPGGYYSLTGCEPCPDGREALTATQTDAGIGTMEERCGLLNDNICNKPAAPSCQAPPGTLSETMTCSLNSDSNGCSDDSAAACEFFSPDAYDNLPQFLAKNGGPDLSEVQCAQGYFGTGTIDPCTGVDDDNIYNVSGCQKCDSYYTNQALGPGTGTVTERCGDTTTIRGRTLNDIPIIGSHNSAAFDENIDPGLDFMHTKDSVAGLPMGSANFIPKLVYRYQKLNFFDQLSAGIQYFDIYLGGNVGSRLYFTDENFIRLNEEYIEDCQSFLDLINRESTSSDTTSFLGETTNQNYATGFIIIDVKFEDATGRDLGNTEKARDISRLEYLKEYLKGVKGVRGSSRQTPVPEFLEDNIVKIIDVDDLNTRYADLTRDDNKQTIYLLNGRDPAIVNRGTNASADINYQWWGDDYFGKNGETVYYGYYIIIFLISAYIFLKQVAVPKPISWVNMGLFTVFTIILNFINFVNTRFEVFGNSVITVLALVFVYFLLYLHLRTYDTGGDGYGKPMMMFISFSIAVVILGSSIAGIYDTEKYTGFKNMFDALNDQTPSDDGSNILEITHGYWNPVSFKNNEGYLNNYEGPDNSNIIKYNLLSIQNAPININELTNTNKIIYAFLNGTMGLTERSTYTPNILLLDNVTKDREMTEGNISLVRCIYNQLLIKRNLTKGEDWTPTKDFLSESENISHSKTLTLYIAAAISFIFFIFLLVKIFVKKK